MSEQRQENGARELPEAPPSPEAARGPYRKPELHRLGTLEDVQAQANFPEQDGGGTQGFHWYAGAG